MRISKAEIKNFRLLSDVSISFEEKTTVIVGRNNSGKTSLAEIFRRLLGANSAFGLEDFSLVAHEGFWRAYNLYHDGAEEPEVREALPSLSLALLIDYGLADPDLALLGDFIVDLDPTCTKARIEVEYRLGDGKLLGFFPEKDDLPDEEQPRRQAFFKAMREQVRSAYSIYVEAVDPNDPTNRKQMEAAAARRLVKPDFINAQRALDSSNLQEGNVLGKILESLFSAASDSSREADKERAEALRAAVAEVEGGMRDGFTSELDVLLPTLEIFGYPGLPNQSLKTETLLDVESLLQNHTKVRYPGLHGVTLPEAYNGLGTRNLVYILLKLLEYFKSYDGAKATPGVHIIFIEEPEAHLHPQMQEVFIAQLDRISDQFSQRYADGKAWPVQFIVTTHSPHMANKAPFRAMRYFLASPVPDLEGVCKTEIKDLKRGFEDIPEEDEKFLHQYMTLTRCDLLFADKAILVEGLSERLLVPVMAEKRDEAAGDGPRLGSQYLSIIEVGGAYAHKFFDLLNFLELKTLVITDLDSVKGPNGGACLVSEGTGTSNACLKHRFGKDVTPAELQKKTAGEKTDGRIRIAYQIPEADDGPCGRSLEAAFILANPAVFAAAGGSTISEQEAWSQAEDCKKSEFALKYALVETEWSAPRYIAQGLEWLAEEAPCDPMAPEEPVAVEPVEAMEAANA